jgi:hypothetical protein
MNLDSWLPEAPGENELPSMDRLILRAAPEEAGCWIDGGARGNHGAYVRMVEIALASGMKLNDPDSAAWPQVAYYDHDPGDLWLNDFLDETLDWLNDHVAPAGHHFGWHEGDLFLLSEQGWCGRSGDPCQCIEPHEEPVSGD